MTFIGRKIEEQQLIEFFGVLPRIDEEECCELYKTEKNELVLETTFFNPTGFRVGLLHRATGKYLVNLDFEAEVRIARKTEKNGYDCLEVMIPFLERFGEPNWQSTLTMEIFVQPDIKIEFTY